MRLTGGLDRGRRLIVPRGSRTRPTAAKVREAIFNILGPPPGPVLDLYAGSGALGLEALSRGAPSAVFVERDGAALSALRRNLREAGVTDGRATVIGADVRSALRKLSTTDRQFSWVFLDPPYVKETDGVLAELSGSDLLTALRGGDRRARQAPPLAAVGRLSVPDRPPQLRRHGALLLPLLRVVSLAVYPGTFDPITNGHVDILRRSLKIFDRVVVALAENVRKKPLFSLGERREFITEALGGDPRLEVDAFQGLLADYCRRRGATVVIRGLRALADFEYEFQLAHMNRHLAPDVETHVSDDRRGELLCILLARQRGRFDGR